MPIICREVPNRTKVRVFNEKDAIRIVCRVIKAGGDKDEIIKGIEKCAGDICQKERVRQFTKLVLEAAVAITTVISFAVGALAITGAALRLMRRVPILAIYAIRAEAAILRLQSSYRKGLLLESEALVMLKFLNKTKVK